MQSQLKDKIREVIIAIMPLVILVVILQFTAINMPSELFIQFVIGVIMVIIGMALFLIGVDIGILPVGRVLGSELPQKGSVSLAVAIAFLLGFTATIAEPDVIVLTGQVDTVSGGTISNIVLIGVIAIGVGLFVAMAILRIIFNFPIAYLFTGGYIIILILSFFTPASFVPVAFDSGGVTTGPMTVPIILALGLGFSSVLSGRSLLTEGFGLIGLASIGPVIGVMIMGILVN